jgi:hypothetical protein
VRKQTCQASAWTWNLGFNHINAVAKARSAVMPPSYLANNSTLLAWWPGLDYIPFFAAIVALIGWCVLAFSRRKEQKTDAQKDLLF